MTTETGVGHVQTLKMNSRATSKYKVLEPTKVADLVKHNVPSYKEPKSDELDNLSDGDLVKICFVNNEELWCVVDSMDGDANSGIVYAKTAEQAMKLQGLQKGQRVAFDVKCVCDIRYHDSDESDDEY